MQTTNLLAIRLPDGRLSFASYKDEEERARILAWAKANNAGIETKIPQGQMSPLNQFT